MSGTFIKTYAERLIKLSVLVSVFAFSGCANQSQLLEGLEDIVAQTSGQSAGVLSIADISAGLKEALTVGSGLVVSQLGQPDGYNADPVVRIPLPTTLVRAKEFAARVGLQSSFDSLENRLNLAAEQAVPKARSLFVDAIRQMTLDDARGILQGPDNGATLFFERTMGGRLRDAMRPVIDNSLSQVGAVRGFNQLLASYRQIPFAPPVEADLTEHVLDKGMGGIWHYMAAEEKAIRNNPVKRTTELLQRVFGSVDR